MAGASSSIPREERSLQFENSLLMPFEFPGEAVRTGFVIKLVQGPEGSKAAAAEFGHLKYLHRRFGGTSLLRVPQPFDHIPELNAIVMERVFAPRLDHLIHMGASWWSGRKIGDLQEHCRHAGRWLGNLVSTDSTSAPSTPETVDFPNLWTAELEAMIERAGALGLPQARARELERALSDPSRHLRGRLTAVHSDFTPYNVHAAPEALYVTDFAEMPSGFGDQCAAFFWAWLEVSRTDPVLSDGALTLCQAAFCEGFGRTLSPFWKTWGLLRQYSYLPEPALVSRSRRWWHRRRLNRLQSSLTEQSRELQQDQGHESPAAFPCAGRGAI